MSSPEKQSTDSEGSPPPKRKTVPKAKTQKKLSFFFCVTPPSCQQPALAQQPGEADIPGPSRQDGHVDMEQGQPVDTVNEVATNVIDSSNAESQVETEVTKVKDCKVKRHFQKTWLDTYQWLKFDGAHMTCKLCAKNKKNNSFTGHGTNNFRTSTLVRHVSSADHQHAVLAGEEKENFTKSVEKAISKEEEGVIVGLKAVYWLCKESLPLSKYASLIKFLKDLKTPNAEYLSAGSNNYDSSYTSSEFLDAIAKQIDQEIDAKLEESPCFTILTDESTDIAIHKKMTIMVRVINPLNMIPATIFIRNTQVNDGTGKHLSETILSHLKDRKVPTTKLLGLGTDGATAMTGRDKGLTGQLLRVSPHLVNVHCIAHRLALCTSQAAECLPSLKDYQETLTSLFYYFRGSGNRTQNLAAIQKILEEPQLKVKEIHQVRWLSFYTALETIYRTLNSLLTYFDNANQRKDPKAVALHKKLSNKQFIFITYMMMDIMPIVTKLSEKFQKKDLDISLVQVTVDQCCDDLQHQLDTDGTFLTKMNEDLQEGGCLENHKISGTSADVLKAIKKKFVKSLIENITKRFPDKQILTSFGVLGLRPVPVMSGEELEGWGEEQLEILLSHYGKPQTYQFRDQGGPQQLTTSKALVDPAETRQEWHLLKAVVKAQAYPTGSMATLWQLIKMHHAEDFPNLCLLACIALTAPVHTADCERTFSVQNRLVTSLRSRLTPDNCDKLMKIILEGPDLKDFNFNNPLVHWRSAKQRRIFTSSKSSQK